MKHYIFIVFAITMSTCSGAEQNAQKNNQAAITTKTPINNHKRPIISQKNLRDKVIEHMHTLCKTKGFTFNEIPERMLDEVNERITIALEKLSIIMKNNERDFVYQNELETITKNTLDFFLSRVNYILVSQMAQKFMQSLELDRTKIRSTRMPISPALRKELNESKRFKLLEITNIR